jgi:hypothetical protein
MIEQKFGAAFRQQIEAELAGTYFLCPGANRCLGSFMEVAG